MKKLLLIGAMILFGTSLFGQIFSDNFDSYNAGDYLVSSNPADWDTWTGGAGGSSEDAKISSNQAASAPNSLHLMSTSAQGGPSDIILRFDQIYTSGDFTLEANFFVENNKGAYFNLQQDHTPGNVWALDCFMLNNGTLKFSNSGTTMLQSTYPTGQWFNLRMEIDLTSNNWEVFVDNVSIGTFSNPVNSIGILDLYPVNSTSEGGNGQSEFYVDDISYNQTPASLPPVNAGVIYVGQVDGIAGQSQEVVAKIRNLGMNDITSFDLTYEYAGGTPVLESVNSINLSSLDIYEYTFTAPITLLSGSNPLKVTVSNVNLGGQDGDASDDFKEIVVDPVIPGTGKIVVAEEATGTWCPWCVRGTTFMEYMDEKYEGYWAGIAVHNNDPMTNTVYDAGIGTKIQGYPSALVDRLPAIDPSGVEEDFLTQIVKQPKAVITNGASFNSGTRELEVSLTYSFSSNISGNWKVACALSEDGVTGTSSGYAQSNAYAGGSNGEMGGYELLPNPVPASQMVYNGVARMIAPSFSGDGTLLPSSLNAGDEFTVCFTFTLPANWDESNMHIIGMLIDPSGKIDNGGYSTIAEAEANGLKVCNSTLNVGSTPAQTPSFNLYPNPTDGMAYIKVDNSKNEEVKITIVDLTGKVVADRTYSLKQDVLLPINTNQFDKGTYIVRLQRGDSIEQKKLIVQ